MEKLKYMCELIKKNAVATCRKWIPYYQENGWNRSLLRFERSLMFAHHYWFEIMNMVWCGVALNLASSVVPITPVAFLPFFSISTCPKWLWWNCAGSMTKYFLFCGLQALIVTAMSEIDGDELKDRQLTNGSLDGRL